MKERTMKEYLTEFDEMQEALKAVRWDEPVMVYRNGMLMENQDAVCKVQKLIDCDQMSESHTYLYDLDLENLEADDVERINKLYDMGVRRGYIEDFDAEPSIPDVDGSDEEKPAEAAVVPAASNPVVQKANVSVPCWTILYSATKDGETKCGECFSNAISVYAAKADCTAKLSRFGYDNISILAIEAGDPDCAGKPDDGIACSCCDEDDMLKNRPHNGHVPAVNEAEETEVAPEAAPDAEPEKKEEEKSAEEAPAAEAPAEEKPAEEAPATEAPSAEAAPAAEEKSAEETPVSGEQPSEEKPAEEASAAEDKPADGSDSEEKPAEEKPSEGAELTDEQKSQLKDEYRKAFKATMLKCKFEERSFNDLTIAEKVQFFEALQKAWTKNEPKDFMTDKEIDQLEAIEAKA